MLVELRVGEQRLRAVWEVLDGVSVSEVARRFGVSRQSVHSWLRRYAADQGLGDRSSRPHGCPHQMSPVVEARIVEIRRAHPGWGADRIGYQLHKDGTVPVPGRTSIYRALLRNGLVSPGLRRRRRADYRRWERARPMELWQMDVVGGFHLADGTELKAVSGIDDSSRFAVSAQLVRRATAGPVCEALLAALRRHGIPEQILTDNGKVFTGRFGPAGSSAEVLFDRICAENGIRHLLTAPRSPTTTGKVERWHKTIRAEFLRDHDHQHATIAGLQAALDGWVNHYNTERWVCQSDLAPLGGRVLAWCGPTLDHRFPLLSARLPRRSGEARGLKERSRVEQFEGIRRDSRDRAMSIRALARRHRCAPADGACRRWRTRRRRRGRCRSGRLRRPARMLILSGGG